MPQRKVFKVYGMCFIAIACIFAFNTSAKSDSLEQQCTLRPIATGRSQHKALEQYLVSLPIAVTGIDSSSTYNVPVKILSADSTITQHEFRQIFANNVISEIEQEGIDARLISSYYSHFFKFHQSAENIPIDIMRMHLVFERSFNEVRERFPNALWRSSVIAPVGLEEKRAKQAACEIVMKKLGVDLVKTSSAGSFFARWHKDPENEKIRELIQQKVTGGINVSISRDNIKKARDFLAQYGAFDIYQWEASSRSSKVAYGEVMKPGTYKPNPTSRFKSSSAGINLSHLSDHEAANWFLNYSPTGLIEVNEQSQAIVVYSDALRQSPALQDIIRQAAGDRRKFYLVNKEQGISTDEFLAGLNIDRDAFERHIFNQGSLSADQLALTIAGMLRNNGIRQGRVFANSETDLIAWSGQGLIEALVMMLKDKRFEIISDYSQQHIDYIRTHEQALIAA